MRFPGPHKRRLSLEQKSYFLERLRGPFSSDSSSRVCLPAASGKLVVSGCDEASLLRPSSVASKIVHVLTVACLLLTVSLIGLPRNIKALLDSGASLNLIHEDFVHALGLITQPCHPIYVTIANGSKLIHANRVVTLKFTLGGVEHQEIFLVAPLGSNQMILGMPWLERVNPNIDWKNAHSRTAIPAPLA